MKKRNLLPLFLAGTLMLNVASCPSPTNDKENFITPPGPEVPEEPEYVIGGCEDKSCGPIIADAWTLMYNHSYDVCLENLCSESYQHAQLVHKAFNDGLLNSFTERKGEYHDEPVGYSVDVMPPRPYPSVDGKPLYHCWDDADKIRALNAAYGVIYGLHPSSSQSIGAASSVVYGTKLSNFPQDRTVGE
jgi:hypothetical protein